MLHMFARAEKEKKKFLYRRDAGRREGGQVPSSCRLFQEKENKKGIERQWVFFWRFSLSLRSRFFWFDDGLVERVEVGLQARRDGGSDKGEIKSWRGLHALGGGNKHTQPI